MPVFISSPPVYTPAAVLVWEDIDDSNVPDGATGVILRVSNIGGQASVYVRKNGSTDGFMGGFIWNGNANSYVYMYVGVDGSGIFELKGDSTTYSKIEIMGYFTEGTFFTNQVQKTISSTSTWEDIDISGDTGADTAVAGIFNILDDNDGVGMRKNGSTDTASLKLMNINGAVSGFIVGVDGSEICEAYREDPSNNFNLIGYFQAGEGVTMNTNATDLTPGSPGSYVDGTSSGDTASIVFAGSFGAFGIDVRKNGSSSTYYYDTGTVFVVEVDESKKIESKIETTFGGILILELGYFDNIETVFNSPTSSKSNIVRQNSFIENDVKGNLISKTVIVSPISGTESSPVYLVWTIPGRSDSKNMSFWVEVDDTSSGFNSLEHSVISSQDSGFEYDTTGGGSWSTIPASGVDPDLYGGNQARVQVTLADGTKYWRVRAGVNS